MRTRRFLLATAALAVAVAACEVKTGSAPESRSPPAKGIDPVVDASSTSAIPAKVE